jgi:hypothetical protein
MSKKHKKEKHIHTDEHEDENKGKVKDDISDIRGYFYIKDEFT